MNPTNSNELFWVVLIFAILFVLSGFTYAWKKKVITIMLSDKELLALFPEKTSFSIEGFACEIQKATSNSVSFSELAERFAKLVKEGKLERKEIPLLSISVGTYPLNVEDNYIPYEVHFLKSK